MELANNCREPSPTMAVKFNPCALLLLFTFNFNLLAKSSYAKPLLGPDVSKCQKNPQCCIRLSKKIVDFKLPQTKKPLRVRKPAHLVDEEYRKKYANATRLMKQLPDSHPWSFKSQVAVHCGYGNGEFYQRGHPGVRYYVHGSWLFFPFHRAYLYFYERILGKLIGDETFALPFWNWDVPEGMTTPPIYQDPNSPLYDSTRERSPSDIVNFLFLEPESDAKSNLEELHRQMVTVAGEHETLFLGGAYRDGEELMENRAGSLEGGVHGAVHVWVGRNMRELASAAGDPLFFAHHANVDRLWKIWEDLPRRNRKGLSDTDWLDTSFLFWDENLQLVRIKVRDVLDIERLGFTYQDAPLPWMDQNSTKIQDFGVPSSMEAQKSAFNLNSFPLNLGHSQMRIPIKRPNLFRLFDNKNKEQDEEAIVINGIRYNNTEQVSFDVYVSVIPKSPRNTLGTTALSAVPAALAGRFINIPLGQAPREMAGRLVIPLNQVLASIGAEQKGTVTVIIVPKEKSSSNVEIQSVEIKYMSEV